VSDFRIIDSGKFKPAQWSGGTTIELFIFPPAASYPERNFQFRLSTATVETDKSDFTSLPGISRKLMVLAGSITITHEDHYSRQLGKFEIDAFDGGWKTSSMGRCTDFNLMTSGQTTGELTAVIIEKEQWIDYVLKDNRDWLFLYVYSGAIEINLNNHKTTIKAGDMLVLHDKIMHSFEMKSLQKSEIIISEITAG
jgi:environmental stress-induced protein Ves